MPAHLQVMPEAEDKDWGGIWENWCGCWPEYTWRAQGDHGRVPPHSTVVLLGSSFKLLLPKTTCTVEDIIHIFKFYVYICTHLKWVRWQRLKDIVVLCHHDSLVLVHPLPFQWGIWGTLPVVVVSSGGAPTPGGTSVFTKHNWDMGMGYLWLNGWGIYHSGAFMAYWVGHLWLNGGHLYHLMGGAFMT